MEYEKLLSILKANFQRIPGAPNSHDFKSDSKCTVKVNGKSHFNIKYFSLAGTDGWWLILGKTEASLASEKSFGILAPKIKTLTFTKSYR